MNFDTGSVLADFQQNLFVKLQNGQQVSAAELSRLEGNYWVKAAETLAPSNLVVRHYCLIDIIKKRPAYYNQIMNQIAKLSYASVGTGRIWSESYSYWQYVKPFLSLYFGTFPGIVTNLPAIISEIDANFAKTAYLRGSVWYPAPFGDLRDVPLDPDFQNLPALHSALIGPVYKKSETFYTIRAIPVGLNPHTPVSNYDIQINASGIPQGFVFYTGYDKKYPSVISEWADILNPKRIFSFWKW